MIGSAFTVTYNGIAKRLNSMVKIAESVAVGNSNFANEYTALWDTGATGSVITQKVVDDLNLLPVSFGRAHGVDGEYSTTYYYVDILLPNNVSVNKLRVSLGKMRGFDLLIGMDIICRGDFAVSNYNGNTVFTYRIPSKQTTDYVK
jgi:predicted aspartyl protease